MWVMKHWHRLLEEVVDACPWKHSSQVGQSSEDPDLVEDVPCHCREVGLDNL